jgi:hypothetical protein
MSPDELVNYLAGRRETMDPVLQPPLRIVITSSQHISTKDATHAFSSFLRDYQTREGDAAVNAQMGKLLMALEEETSKKR